METVTVTAREAFTYADIPRHGGDVFEAPVKDARVLLLLGKVDTEQALPPEQSHRQDISAKSSRKRGRSKRQDIVSEG